MGRGVVPRRVDLRLLAIVCSPERWRQAQGEPVDGGPPVGRDFEELVELGSGRGQMLLGKAAQLFKACSILDGHI